MMIKNILINFKILLIILTIFSSVWAFETKLVEKQEDTLIKSGESITNAKTPSKPKKKISSIFQKKNPTIKDKDIQQKVADKENKKRWHILSRNNIQFFFTGLMLIVTFLIYKTNSTSTKILKTSNEILKTSNEILKMSNEIMKIESRPIINFYPDRSEFPNWIFINMGKGVALNLLVAHVNATGEIDLDKKIRNYNALPPGESRRIKWVKHPNKLVAQYQDIYNKDFTVVCEGNNNTYYEEKLYKDWDDQAQKPYWKMLREGEADSSDTNNID